MKPTREHALQPTAASCDFGHARRPNRAVTPTSLLSNTPSIEHECQVTLTKLSAALSASAVFWPDRRFGQGEVTEKSSFLRQRRAIYAIVNY